MQFRFELFSKTLPRFLRKDMLFFAYIIHQEKVPWRFRD
jgi:hypothetical protein